MPQYDTETELPTIKRLGTSYSSLTNVRPQCDPGNIKLLLAPVSVTRLSLWTTLALVLLALFAFFSWSKAAIQMGWLAVPIFVAIAVLTLFGPIIMVLHHNSQSSRVNPLIEVDLSEGVVRVRNGQKVFPVAEVHSLIAATVSDSEGGRLSELQLMVHHGHSLVAELVCTKYNSSSRRSFGKALSAMSPMLPFPTFVVEPKGFFGRGQSVVTKV
jgi:hypothetical protein